MNESAFQKIREVLPTTGGQPSMDKASPKDILHRTRVTPSTVLPPMRHLFNMYDTPCFYRGELVAVCGRAKSGKTLFLSMIMACCLTEKVLALERSKEHTEPADSTDVETPEKLVAATPLKVLWLDTEQSAQSTQDILVNRILRMVRNSGGKLQEGVADLKPETWSLKLEDSFFAFNLRGYGYETRKKVMEYAINQLEPDLVIIDGIKDLVTDINDAVQATLIMEQLMALAQNNSCCIVNVLHMNKSEADKNMRGSIGTELNNKAFEVFQCEYIEESEKFKVKHAMSRKQRSKRKMYYQLDEDGIPAECEDQPRDSMGRFASKPQHTVTSETKWDTLNQKYVNHHDDGSYSWKMRELMEDAFEGRSERPYNQLMGAAMRLTNIQDGKTYYALLDDAVKQDIVRMVKHPETGETWLRYNNGELPF